MLQITSSGLTIDRLDAIIQRLQEGMQSIYGSDINTDPDTQDGEFISIYGQEIADLNELIAGAYAFSDPTKAIGKWLDIQVKYVGIERKQATYSYLNDVKVVAEIGTIIPSGSIYKDANNTLWQTVASTTVKSNPTYIQLRSSETGAFYLQADKELLQQTVVLGVQSLFSTKASDQGNLEESDEALLIRFLRSYSVNNYDDRDGLEAKIINLDGVTDVRVYENFTGETDSRDVRPHCINTVVLGGSDESIALTILRQKSLGCDVQGSTSVKLFYKEQDRVINFDRATPITVNVNVLVSRKNSAVDVNKDAIISAIKANSFSINEEVFAGGLYCGASTDNYKLKSITLNSDNALSVPIGLREYAVIGTVEVTIE